ncbi:MAG: hypothetical protein LBU76_09910 [Azoarcus sp.]|jgi:hypothetical protein|nr:hypothetical protein [Azoarcus sp.]
MQNISDLQKKCIIDDCKIKYYKNLNFIDVFENIYSATKKKSTAFSNVEESGYSIGYFRDDRLIRLDNVGDAIIPNETYFIWNGAILVEAHTYYTGFKYGKRITNKPTLHASFYYEYENSMLKQITWLSYEDKTYYYSDAMRILYTYEYDKKGLLFIHKTIQGKNWTEPITCIEFDRNKENFLKHYTVSKIALINTDSKTNDGLVDFNNRDDFKTKKCFQCESSLTYILSIDLEAKKLHRKVLPISKIPVLHCFECGCEQHYSMDELNTAISGRSYMENTAYRFIKTAVEDRLANAFIVIGGKPDWIQDDAYPFCRLCGKPMIYIMEIKSWEERTNTEYHLMFGDEGSLFVFTCCGYICTLPQSS